MRILFVGYRDQRHSKFGGYDYIAEYPKADYLDAKTLPFGFIPVAKRGKKLNLLFLYMKALLISNKYDIVHFFYGDFMLFTKLHRKTKTKYIATIHMKSEDLDARRVKILQSFDGVIVLSSSEKELTQQKKINSFFVPHGFNTPAFNKISITYVDNNLINIFYSGMNYRDFSTFIEIVKFSQKENLNIHFYAVGQSQERKDKLQDYSNVTICKRLNDDEYYSLLNECDYNFLPLTFSTANNALLEAQSFGIKSILPKINGIEDYADKNNNILYEDYDELKSIFRELKKETPDTQLKKFSESFLWKEIYLKLESIYTSINKQ